MSVEGARAARAIAGSYSAVVGSLGADEWERPSRCAGWTVRDLVAHTGSNFRAVAEPAQEAGDPALTAEQQQEALVRERSAWSAAEVAGEFLHYMEPALAVFDAVQAAPAASAPLTMSDLGTYPTHSLADAFAFDMWCHLYVDLLAPEGPVVRPVGEAQDEELRPGIGWMLSGLPQMCPAVSRVLDRPLGLRLTGPGGGSWTLQPGEPFLTVQEGAGDAATLVTSPAPAFVLWGTARAPWRELVSLTGDADWAAGVLDRINIV